MMIELLPFLRGIEYSITVTFLQAALSLFFAFFYPGKKSVEEPLEITDRIVICAIDTEALKGERQPFSHTFASAWRTDIDGIITAFVPGKIVFQFRQKLDIQLIFQIDPFGLINAQSIQYGIGIFLFHVAICHQQKFVCCENAGRAA